MNNFKDMSSAELVAYYNLTAARLGESGTKRFASRAAGIKRCQAIEVRFNERAAADQAAHMAKVEEEGAKPAAPSASRADAIAESWKNPTTAAKRAQRNGVRVDGVEFRSVRQAFLELGLPLNKHIKFRMELKERGTLHAFDKNWEIL